MLAFLLAAPSPETEDAKEIIRKADQVMRGTTAQASMNMQIIRPDYTREMSMKSWSLEDDFALVVITAPARDRGTAFLKREKEIWNWQPSIDRVVKMPPSMMMQSWMGSDFTNDDLVQQSSIVDDFSHRIIEEQLIQERECYVIELIPKEDAAVVWGKIIHWVDKEASLILKSEFFDEDDYLINTMNCKEIRELDDRTIASVLEIIPAEAEGERTIIEYSDIAFDVDLDEGFFSIQNLKRIRY